MTHEEIVDTLIRFMTDGQNVQIARACAINPASRLIEDGVIDSLGLFSLISFVEETFGIAVDDDDVVGDIFGTIDALASYVLRKHPAN